MKLTPKDLQKFESHIKKSYEGVVFELMVTHNILVGHGIELTSIIVQDRKQGIGTAIMRERCEFADRQAAEIGLTPASKGGNAATTSRARLTRFYKRFGFGAGKRKAGEITAIPALIRKPSRQADDTALAIADSNFCKVNGLRILIQPFDVAVAASKS